jgi:hypothetical protein
MANTEVFRQIANMYGFTNKGSAHYCVMEVLDVLATQLHNKYIKWPTGEQCSMIAAEFEEKTGFPGVIGCIDGTHIPIKPPASERAGFINRSGKPSINVLAVCDNLMRFTHVFVDRAGSVHDARVLRVSPLGPPLLTNTLCDSKYHILGDSAYPLLPQLIVPYRDNGHLTSTQKKFNTVHSSTRSTVERSFARLKTKMRRLRGLESTLIRNAVTTIKAAFTLHNFIIHREGDIDDDTEQDLDEGDSGLEENDSSMGTNTAGRQGQSLKQAAQAKRDGIANLF